MNQKTAKLIRRYARAVRGSQPQGTEGLEAKMKAKWKRVPHTGRAKVRGKMNKIILQIKAAQKKEAEKEK